MERVESDVVSKLPAVWSEIPSMRPACSVAELNWVSFIRNLETEQILGSSVATISGAWFDGSGSVFKVIKKYGKSYGEPTYLGINGIASGIIFARPTYDYERWHLSKNWGYPLSLLEQYNLPEPVCVVTRPLQGYLYVPGYGEKSIFDWMMDTLSGAGLAVDWDQFRRNTVDVWKGTIDG